MSEHLTEAEIKAFSQHTIKGKERVRILLHLESCETCRSALTAPDKKNIIQRLHSPEQKFAAGEE